MGAKFSSGGGATVFYDDGPITAPSGEQGTQRTEFEAAIKSVTSSTDVGAVFLYDTRNDSDGGAWRKKCAGLSWFDESASATRSSRSEFPSVALLVGDAGADTLTIYDLDDPSIPVWMVFQQGGSGAATNAIGTTAATFSSIAALNGIICVGGANAAYLNLQEINLLTEEIHRHSSASDGGFYQGNIAERNGGKGWGGTMELIADYRANDVAMTVLEGAEIGALGLPIPTIAVACNSPGASVIHPNGDVYNFTVGSYDTNAVAWDKDGLLIQFVNGTQRRVDRVPFGSLYTNTTVSSSTVIYNLTNSGWSASDGMALGVSQSSLITAGEKTVAQGGASGLQIVKRQAGNDSGTGDNLAAHITSTYNTGYMLGDIRFAGLAGSGESGDIAADRSVKAHTLTKHGTGITDPVVATDAELRGITGFSASSYLSKAYTSDFDFGTGDFSIIFWCNLTSTSNTEAIIARYAPDDASPDWLLAKHSTDTIKFFTDGANAISTASAVSGRWAQVCVLRRGSTVEIYVDGKLDGSGTNSANLTNTSAVLGIGIIPTSSVSNPLASTSSLSLVRISATAPTPLQVKEMYEAEWPLFQVGAKCLLGYSSEVSDLAYDKGADLLYVPTQNTSAGAGVGSVFRGLEKVQALDSAADFGHSGGSVILENISAANGVVAVGSAAHVGVNLPAIDVRGDINTADSKLPDDGKIHFSAAIDDGGSATPTVIGVLPIAEGDTYLITARVFCRKYVDNSSNIRASYVIKQRVNRPVGGNATANTPLSVLRDEGTASMDAVFSADTGSQQIRLTVTGVANNRSIWTAELDVERESEKQYER